VAAILFGGMDRDFRRRQSEDEPSVAGVNGREAEDIFQEGAISRWVIAVYDDVCAKDHDLCSVM
jgi:hypothetical protein